MLHVNAYDISTSSNATEMAMIVLLYKEMHDILENS